jgi:hypothetical protein
MAEYVQLSVSRLPATGLPGMLADANIQDVKIDSLIATEALPFGIFVVTSENECSLPDGGATDVTNGRGGIVLRDPAKPTGEGYEAGDVVPVLRKGRVFVLTEETVTYDDAVYVRYASGGGGSQAGSFGDDADTATRGILPNSKYRYGGTTTNPAVLDLDLLG